MYASSSSSLAAGGSNNEPVHDANFVEKVAALKDETVELRCATSKARKDLVEMSGILTDFVKSSQVGIAEFQARHDATEFQISGLQTRNEELAASNVTLRGKCDTLEAELIANKKLHLDEINALKTDKGVLISWRERCAELSPSLHQKREGASQILPV